jgi:hypothetical protein
VLQLSLVFQVLPKHQVTTNCWSILPFSIQIETWKVSEEGCTGYSMVVQLVYEYLLNNITDVKPRGEVLCVLGSKETADH